jgi:hypothetical protein
VPGENFGSSHEKEKIKAVNLKNISGPKFDSYYSSTGENSGNKHKHKILIRIFWIV